MHVANNNFVVLFEIFSSSCEASVGLVHGNVGMSHRRALQNWFVVFINDVTTGVVFVDVIDLKIKMVNAALQ